MSLSCWHQSYCQSFTPYAIVFQEGGATSKSPVGDHLENEAFTQVMWKWDTRSLGCNEGFTCAGKVCYDFITYELHEFYLRVLSKPHPLSRTLETKILQRPNTGYGPVCHFTHALLASKGRCLNRVCNFKNKKPSSGSGRERAVSQQDTLRDQLLCAVGI